MSKRMKDTEGILNIIKKHSSIYKVNKDENKPIYRFQVDCYIENEKLAKAIIDLITKNK